MITLYFVMFCTVTASGEIPYSCPRYDPDPYQDKFECIDRASLLNSKRSDMTESWDSGDGIFHHEFICSQISIPSFSAVR